MAHVYHDQSADLSLIRSKRVGIIGYGSQGHAHALNLADNGVEVRVGLPPTSRSRDAARRAGFVVGSVAEVCAWADVVMLLTPDTSQPAIYRNEIAPNLKPGSMLMFAHGFNIRYKTIECSKDVDVMMVAPKAPGHRVREVFEEGGGTPALFAIHQDATGEARALALSYAKAIGCTRAGVLETTFAEETETDLFGEQAVLCGGAAALVKAGFETLVEAGYQPEIAYFECLHELKLIVDLMYRGGLNFMRYSVSDTAEYGDYTAGERVVTDETRAAMKKLLSEIQDGSFAKAWIAENKNGLPNFKQRRERERNHAIERVGEELRAMMPFLKPVKRKPQAATVPAMAAVAVSGPDGFSY